MAQHFEGVIGRDWRDSTPWWPEEPAAPRGAPSVLLIVLDAVGHAQLGRYGSHLTPDDEVNMAASRASWPLGRGFDRWYGFHGGETHQFAPALYHDNHAVLAPGTYEDGYHLSADLADRAIEFLSDLRAVDEDQP